MECALAYNPVKFANLTSTAKIELLKSLLKNWTTGIELHKGLKQRNKKLKPLEFPEKLLVILFIHRYAVTDKDSLNNLKKLVSSDFIPIQEQIEPNFQLYDPSWLRKHVVINIVEISNNTLGGGHDGEIQTRVLNTPKATNTRLKMAIYHTTAKAFVQILLKYGGHPKLPEGKQFDEFRAYLNMRKTNDQPTTATEVVLDALPYIFKHHMTNSSSVTKIIRGLPLKVTCMSDKWIHTVTLDHFNLYVPALLTQGESVVKTAVSIFNYFDKIFDGSISYEDVLKFAPVLPETKVEKKVKTPVKGGGGGGGGGGGSGTPRKKAQDQPINVERIQQCLSTIDSGVQGIRQKQNDVQETEQLLTSITEATTEIRNLVSQPTVQEPTPDKNTQAF